MTILLLMMIPIAPVQCVFIVSPALGCVIHLFAANVNKTNYAANI